MDIEALARIFRDKTKRRILLLLNKRDFSVTELWKELQIIRNREGVFKALENLRKNKLIKRKFDSKLNGYMYSLAFKEIRINHKLYAYKRK